ncbi:hypothetical protein ACHAXT_003532 [Thalassiosira profunda]
MLFSNPFGYEYGGDPFSSSYGRRRRQQQELARGQRLLEEERRRRDELERRRRAEQELARRRELELRERMKREQARRRRIAEQQAREARASSYPPGTVVRGPDGKLYRIAAPRHREWVESEASDMSTDERSRASNEEAENEVDGHFPMEKEVFRKESSSGDESDIDMMASPEWHNCKDLNINSEVRRSESPKKCTSDIVVETVPDEEDAELNDLHSIWRNRAPSPGQWMEPVESFGQ